MICRSGAVERHVMSVNGQGVSIWLWDTGSQEAYRSLLPSHYHYATAAIAVYDITNQASFDNLNRWIDQCQLHAPSDVILAIVGAKTDLEAQRVVSREMAEQFAQSLSGKFKNIIVMECSAKTGEGVHELFEVICSIISNNNC